jgi:hypothetical protein
MVGSVTGCGGGGAGPYAWPKGGGKSVTGIPVKTGQLAVTALHLDPIAARAVLLDVRPQYADDAKGLRLRYAASTGRGLHIGGARGWRPRSWDLRPLAGFVIHPHTPAAVVVGAAAAEPGDYLMRGFIVDYRIGGTHYSAPNELGWKCVPEGVRVLITLSTAGPDQFARARGLKTGPVFGNVT